MSADTERARVLEDFDQARKEAAMKEILAGLRGKKNSLLSFDEIQDRFKADPSAPDSVQNIPLDAVRGSVGRYNDFNADFLPTNEHDRERWAGVKLAMESNIDLPPIQVYKIGEIYFVIDGNHRVSIAKHRGDSEIRARVTEIPARVDLTVQDSVDDVLLKAALNNFLEVTRLDEILDAPAFQATEVGSFPLLLQQIEMARFKLEMEGDQAVSLPDAARAWFDDFYQPVIDILRAQNLLKYYPGRTEADLYVWLLENHQALADELGWGMNLETIAAGLAERKQRGGRIQQLLKTAADPEAETGAWRERRLAAPKGHMFSDVLVVLDPDDPLGPAFQQGLRIAGEESAHLLGLWIRSQAESGDGGFETLQAQYEEACREMDVYGRLALGRGERAELVRARARWADLVVLQSSRGRAPSRALVNVLAGVHIPVWVARREVRPLERVLLAYDGSPKANEALFLTAYMGALWGYEISVLTVKGSGRTAEIQAGARTYFERYSIDAEYILADPPVPDAILAAIDSEGAGLLATGSVHTSRLGRSSLGKTLERLLAESPVPLLICR